MLQGFDVMCFQLPMFRNPLLTQRLEYSVMFIFIGNDGDVFPFALPPGILDPLQQALFLQQFFPFTDSQPQVVMRLSRDAFDGSIHILTQF